MRKLIVLLFAIGLLAAALAVPVSASPYNQGANGNGYGTCNGPGNYTNNYNSGEHWGQSYYC